MLKMTKLRWLAIFWVAVGLLNVNLGSTDASNWEYLVMGSVEIIFGIGLWFRWLVVRYLVLLVSLMFIAMIYFPFVFASMKMAFHGYALMGLLATTPMFILCVLSLVILRQPATKALFFKFKKS